MRSARRTPPRSLPVRRQAGFTLLEVILAIAILAISLAAVGHVARSAFTNANQAADALEARLVAQMTIDELKCGVLELASVGPLQRDQTQALSDWQVQVLVEPAPVEQLVQVRVLVGRTLEANERPTCELVRWFQNPEYVMASATSTP